MLVLVCLSLGLLAFALWSHRLAGSVLTAPMWFTALGLLLAYGQPMGFELEEHREWVHMLAEITLVLVLFTDASRIDLRMLWREHDLPVRMLGIGLPLTIVLGAVLGGLMFPQLGWPVVALIAAILAPTDAALGQAVVSDPSVPVKIRQTLNVESGLNDGIALPVVLLCIYAVDASHADGDGTASYWLRFAALQVTFGPLAGAVVGGVGGYLLSGAIRAGRACAHFASLATLGLAVLAFATAELLGGNGFLAAFVAGTVLGNTANDLCDTLVEFGESEGQLLSLLTFAAFGALLAPVAIERFDAAILGYSLLSLTVIRGVPVWLSLRGKRLDWSTLAFLAWFGPRGIASILFALVVVESSEMPLVNDVLAVVATTVLLSVFLHGITAAPWARWYGRHAGDSARGAVSEMPLRHRRPGSGPRLRNS